MLLQMLHILFYTFFSLPLSLFFFSFFFLNVFYEAFSLKFYLTKQHIFLLDSLFYLLLHSWNASGFIKLLLIDLIWDQ